MYVCHCLGQGPQSFILTSKGDYTDRATTVSGALSNHPADSQLSSVQSKVTKDYQGWHYPTLGYSLDPLTCYPPTPLSGYPGMLVLH